MTALQWAGLGLAVGVAFAIYLILTDNDGWSR